MSLYLDASVVLPTLIKEPHGLAVDDFLVTATQPLVISEFAAAEVASAISRLIRTGMLDREAAASRLQEFDGWRATATIDMDVQPADVRLAHVFVRRFDLMLRAPDALHLAACKRAGHVLVTLDRRLAAAAERVGVAADLLN